MKNLFKNNQIKFLVILLISYLFLNYGLKFITGLAVPGGSYSSFINKYVNIANYTRNAIMYCVQLVSDLFGYNTFRETNLVLKIEGGSGIKLVYGCLGYGVMSFWIAFIIAAKSTFKFKLAWLFGGLILLWIINIIRISLVLISTVKKWEFPFGIDQHTWFNIVAYFAIFIMIYFFEKRLKYQNE